MKEKATRILGEDVGRSEMMLDHLLSTPPSEVNTTGWPEFINEGVAVGVDLGAGSCRSHINLVIPPRPDLPVLFQECDTDGNYNHLDIYSLSGMLAWAKANSRNIDEGWMEASIVEDGEYGFVDDIRPLPNKMTKINKALNSLPCDTLKVSRKYNYIFLDGPIQRMSFCRLDDTIFLVEIIA